jgi:hypothetical protein
MKEAIWFMIFLLMSTVAIAADAGSLQLYKGTIKPFYNYATVEKDPFTVDVLGEQAKVIIYLPGFSMAAANNTCSFNEDYKFCVTNLVFSHYNYTLYPSRMVYKADIQLFVDTADVSLNRTIMPLTLYAGQMGNVSIEIGNYGFAEAHNLTYTDNLSKYFDVFPIASSLCDYKAGVLSWKGNLSEATKIRCSALLKAKQAAAGPSVGTLEYYTRLAKRAISATSAIIIKETPLKINYTGTTRLYVGQMTTLNFNVSAMENLSVVSILINASPHLLVNDSSGIKKTPSGAYSITGGMQKGDSKAFNFTLVPLATGANELTIQYTTHLNYMVLSYSTASVINATISKPHAIVSNTTYADGGPKLSILLNNPSNFNFYNISVQAGSPVNGETYAGMLEIYGHKELEIPFDALKGTYNTTIKITYYSEYNEKFEESINVPLLVTNAPQKLQSVVPKKQQPANVEQENFVEKYSPYAKYAAIGGVAIVIIAIIFWVIRRKKQEELLGA